MELRPCLGTVAAGDRVCFVGAERRVIDAYGVRRFTVERWTEAAPFPPIGVALEDSRIGLVSIRRDAN